MAIKTKTITNAVHRTTIEAKGEPKRDGGRALLLESFDLIHQEHQVGTLTVNFGPGGSITLLTFEERELIPQRSIEFPGDSQIDTETKYIRNSTAIPSNGA